LKNKALPFCRNCPFPKKKKKPRAGKRRGPTNGNELDPSRDREVITLVGTSLLPSKKSHDREEKGRGEARGKGKDRPATGAVCRILDGLYKGDPGAKRGEKT